MVKHLCLWRGSLLLWGPLTQHVNEKTISTTDDVTTLSGFSVICLRLRQHARPELQTCRIKNLINRLIVPLQHNTSPLNSQRCSHRYPCICPLPAICRHKGGHLLQSLWFSLPEQTLGFWVFLAQSLQSWNTDKCTVLMCEKRERRSFFCYKSWFWRTI